MRTGVHFHGKLSGLYTDPINPSESIQLFIRIDMKAIDLLVKLGLFKTYTKDEEMPEIEVTIAHD